jgi:hypothetical protein
LKLALSPETGRAGLDIQTTQAIFNEAWDNSVVTLGDTTEAQTSAVEQPAEPNRLLDESEDTPNYYHDLG